MNLELIFVDDFGNVKITKDELKELVRKAYDEGYAQGCKSPSPSISPITTPTYPWTPVGPNWVYTTGSNFLSNNTEDYIYG